MQNPWDLWKSGFAAWDKATTQYTDKLLRNPSLLGPAGALLTAAMKSKLVADKAMASLWSNVGLPSKDGQHRALHKLNQLESRILDLEEELAELRKQREA